MNLTFAGDKEFIAKITEIILSNIGDENFGAGELIRESGLNRTAINQRLRKISGKSVNQFIRETRLQQALELLRSGRYTAAEVAHQVGFGSPTYFNTCFHERFGYSPGETGKHNQNLGDEDKYLPEELGEIIKEEKTGLQFRRKVIIAASGALVIFVFISLGYFAIFGESGIISCSRMKMQEKSLAILPFKNLSNNPDNQYLADGIMNEILLRLSPLKGLNVKSSQSVEQFRESTKTIPEIAKILNANYILEGSLQKTDDKVRVIVQLIKARNDKHILSEKLDSEITDIFNIESDIATKVAGILAEKLTPEEMTQVSKKSTQNPEAYNSYLLGLFYIKKDTKEGLRKSKEYFEKAIALDPSFAAAYAWLGEVYISCTVYRWMSLSEGYGKAKENILKALELNQNLAVAHKSLANYFLTEWKWEDAEKEFLHAIRLCPDEPSPHSAYSTLLNVMRRNEEARKEIDIALKSNPLSENRIYWRAYYYYCERKFNESLDGFQMMKEISPEEVWPYWGCLWVYFWQNEGLKATVELQKIMSMDTASVKYVNDIKKVYDQSGKDGLLNWLIGWELHNPHPDPLYIAMMYAHLGQKEMVLNYLEKAVEERVPLVARINNYPELENFRDHPRFIALLKKMGLYDYR